MTARDGVSPRRPAGLGARGRRLWDDIVAGWDLTAVELLILENAAREADIIERLRVALEDAPLTVAGSMGQEAASPLVTEIRLHRATLASLLKHLKLPDLDGQTVRQSGRNSVSARKAAMARWGRDPGA
jgi:hypothetical protein